MNIRNHRTPPMPKPNGTRIGGGQPKQNTGTPSTQVTKSQAPAAAVRPTGVGAIKDSVDNSGPSAAVADTPNDDGDLNAALNKATDSSGQLRRSSGKSPSVQSKPSSSVAGKKNGSAPSNSSNKSVGRSSGGRKAGGRSKAGQEGPIDNATGLKNIRGAEGNQEEPGLGDDGKRSSQMLEPSAPTPTKVAAAVAGLSAIADRIETNSTDSSSPLGEDDFRFGRSEGKTEAAQADEGSTRVVSENAPVAQLAETASAERRTESSIGGDLAQELSSQQAPAFRDVVERAPTDDAPAIRLDDKISVAEERAFQQIANDTPKGEMMASAIAAASDGEVAPQVAAAGLAQREVDNQDSLAATSVDTGPVRIPAGVEGAEAFQRVANEVEDGEPFDGVLLDNELRGQAAERGVPFVLGAGGLSGNSALVHVQVRDMAAGLAANGQNASDIQAGLEAFLDSDGGGDEGDDADDEMED